MSKILIVEDSPTQATQIELMLADQGYETLTANDGLHALEQIAASAPDLILTDLHMPNMDGLQLVERVREQYDSIPVILMTADGTETIAVEALKKGAASYIPKRFLDRDLIPIVGNVIDMLQKKRSVQSVFSALVESQTSYEFGNDHAMVTALVNHFEQELRNMQYTDQTGLLRITLALRESLINAIDHGNLELNSNVRDDHPEQYAQLGRERQQLDPYCERSVSLKASIAPNQVTFVIRDQGPGFDPATIPDPRDPENLLRAHGRGLMLIQTFMDHVEFNATGNEITMIKKREKKASSEAA